MSSVELKPLAQDIADLLEDEKRFPSVASETQNRVLERVEGTLGLLPPAGGDSSGGGAAPVGAAGAAAAATAVSSFFAKGAAIAVASFALGGVVGAAVHAQYVAGVAPVPLSVPSSGNVAILGTAPAVSAPPETSASPSATASAARVVPSAELRATAPASASASATVDSDAGTQGRDTDLASERALLEIARTAVARNQGGAALDALAKHAQQFPRGRLTEEREVLWIQALASAGRTTEARQRAALFRQRFPRSMALPAVDSIVGTNP